MTQPVTAAELAGWLADGPTSIGDGLLMLSSVLTSRGGVVEHGRFALDELADTVTTSTTSGIVDALFGSDGFRGDVENYHAEENSLLDRVIERRVGMPITLSAVVVEIGARVDVPLSLVGMPGHVIVGTDVANEFIDAFGGVEVNSRWVQKRFESIFGPEAVIPSQAMQKMDVVSTVNRVCNNLMRTWSDDRSDKMGRLLELRSLLPASSAERALLIDIATGRGRFDIAARLREIENPNDPEIQALWSRLN